MSKKIETKRWVSDSYNKYSISYDSIESVIDLLNKALEDQKNGLWKDLSLQSEDSSIYICGDRPETEQEAKNRVDSEAEYEEHLRKQYETLKKRFEK